jgi:hypothetical protein
MVHSLDPTTAMSDIWESTTKKELTFDQRDDETSPKHDHYF